MAKDISNAESPVQHEMTANPNVLIDASEGQADTVNVLDDDTSSIRTIALEPPNTSSSEQVTLQEPILNQPIVPLMHLAPKLTPNISIGL